METPKTTTKTVQNVLQPITALIRGIIGHTARHQYPECQKAKALTGENLSSTLLLRNENREFVTNQGMSRNSQKGYAKDIKDPLNVGTRFPCTHWALSRGWQRDRNN